jgi:hypothetical protein
MKQQQTTRGELSKNNRGITALRLEVMRLSTIVENGLSKRVEWIERMQWWQIGILVTLVGVVIGGLFILYQSGSSERLQVITELRHHIESTGTGGTP